MTSRVSPTATTTQFVQAILSASERPLPDAAAQATRRVVLDTFGAMLAASSPSWPGTTHMGAFIAGEQSAGSCLVVGTPLSAGPALASLANGYLAYALDIETHHGPAVMHAAAGVVPAAFATAQTTRATGAAFLSAVALGIEVACRVSLAIGPNDLYGRGFHPSAVAGAFGAAAASGLLLGLDPDRFANALGLAATQASGLLAWASDETEESRPFNPGIAARNGVTAARLASLGFGAPQGIFDRSAKYHVFRAWSNDGEGRPEELLKDFGDHFAVEGLTFKVHACCAFLHPALDALLGLMAAHRLAAADVSAIQMRFPASGAPIIDGNPLRSHCAQYILPVAATRGAVRFEDVLHDRSAEPEVVRLGAATSITHDDELDRDYPDRYTTVLELRTTSGQTVNQRVEWPRGCPQNPLTEQELKEKFLALVAPRLSRPQAEEIGDLAVTVDQPGHLETLIDRLKEVGGVGRETAIAD
ncbi:MAG: hypothetical protein QOG89_775 [Thermomicrobiales bacterium]|nr:hypothetical protein [Thermomicrobiales bacterium]